MLNKLFLSALSLVGLGQQPEKPEALDVLLGKHIPIHDIQSIIAGYISGYEPTKKIELMAGNYQKFSANSRYLVSLTTDFFNYGRGQISVWNMFTDKTSWASWRGIKLAHLARCYNHQFIAGFGNDMVIWGSEKEDVAYLCIFDVELERVKKTIVDIPGNSALKSGNYTSDGRIFAYHSNNEVRLFDTKIYNQTESFVGRGDFLHNEIHFSPNNNYIMGYTYADIYIWHVRDHKLSAHISKQKITENKAGPLAFFAQVAFLDNYLVVLLGDYSVIVWDPKSNKKIMQFNFIESGYSRYYQLSSHGLYIACQKQQDSTVSVWHTLTGKKLYTLDTGGICVHLFFAKNNQLLIAGTADQIHVFDLTTGRYLDQIKDLNLSDIYACEMSPDGRYLAVEQGEQKFGGTRMFQIFQNPLIEFEIIAQEKRRQRLQNLIRAQRIDDSKKRATGDYA